MWYTLRMVLSIVALRFLRWMKPVLVFLVLVYCFIAFGGGSWIDSICVEGKLSQVQVEALNSLEWEKCPGYRKRANGGCTAEINDRVVIRECSQFSRAFFLRDYIKFRW